jgi:prevent-host-death family protein
MNTFNIREAQAHMEVILKRVAAGEEIVIVNRGKPVARLVPYKEAPKPRRKPGSMKGKIWISPDFDKPDPELEALFYDSPIEPEQK